MSVLAHDSWRRTRVAFFVCTLLGAFLVPLVDGGLFRFSVVAPQVNPWPAWLAAIVAARLATHARGTDEYWSALPLDRRVWFTSRISAGLAIVTASFVLQTLAHLSAFHTFAFQWAASGPYPAPVFRPLIADSAALALVTFAITAYFAQSFELPLASRQAGWPGYFVSIVVPGLSSGELILHPLRSWSIVAAVTLLAFACARSLAVRRAPAAGTSDEGLVTRGTVRARLLHAVGQAAFVVTPLVMLVADFAGQTAPRLGGSPLLVALALCFCVALVALPRTLHLARDARTSIERVLVVSLRATGLGAPLQKALVPAPALTACRSCGVVRAAALGTCARCGGRVQARVREPWLRAKLRLDSPVNAVSVLLFTAIPLLVAWTVFKPAAAQWTARSTLPGVQLRVGDAPESHTEVRGTLFGGPDPRTSLAGHVDVRVVLEQPERDGRDAAALRALFLGEHLADDQATACPGLLRDAPIPGDAALALVVGGVALPVGRARVSASFIDGMFTTTVELEPALAELRADARTFAQRLIDGRTTEELRLASALRGEPFVTLVVHELGDELAGRNPRSALGRARARRARDAFRNWIAPGSWSDAYRDDERARAALRDLAEREPLPRPGYAPNAGPFDDWTSAYAPLCVLASCASDELLEREIRDRNAYAAVAVAMRADTDLQAVCERLLEVNLRWRHFRDPEGPRGIARRTALVFEALLTLDRARTLAFVQRTGLDQRWPSSSLARDAENTPEPDFEFARLGW